MTSGFCPGGGTGPACIQCLFGGDVYTVANTATAEATKAAGDYAVTITLGGAEAGDTYVSAETNRGLLRSVTTTAGQSLTYAFVVDVRAKEGQPSQATGSGGYAGLDLFFSGTSPQVSAIGYALVTAATKPVMVYVAGDSTTCDQTGLEFGGWAQMIPQFFDAPIGVANYADSGESSSSFYGNSSMWGAIKSKWTEGDWVFIQFGHNDKSASDAQVSTNLQKYVADAKAAKVNAILVAPPPRVGSVPIGSQSVHEASAQDAASKTGVPFIDLTALATAWYNTLGSKPAAMKFHAMGTDGTHTNIAGADKLAELVAKDIKTQNLGLAKYLRQ
jgi:lysophospholipase L1-like esterase